MNSLVTLLLSGAIHIYRLCLAPLLPGQCRYLPSCSQYGLEALHQHGPAHGSWLILRRLLRCHPWGGHGFDPVPPPIPPHLARPAAGRPLANRQQTCTIDKATPHV